MSDDIIVDPCQETCDALKFTGKNTVTEESIKNKIDKVWFTLTGDTKTTICSIQMKNGYSVIGVSSCVDPKNFDKELGEKYSFEDALNKIWPLEGYALAERLYLEKINKNI